jgi:hypothetical protein
VKRTRRPWKLWNSFERDGLLRCERIGPRGGGGIRGSNGVEGDLVASREDLELAAAAPELLEACKEFLAIHTADCVSAEEFRQRLQQVRVKSAAVIAKATRTIVWSIEE